MEIILVKLLLPASTVLSRNKDTISHTSQRSFKNKMSLKYVNILVAETG